MMEYSTATQRSYDPDNCVFYRNGYQAAWMMTHPDCTLLDVFESNGKLVYVFSREDHKKYIKEWNNRVHD